MEDKAVHQLTVTDYSMTNNILLKYFL